MAGPLAVLHEQLGIKDALPQEFIQGFILNFCLTWALFGFSCLIGPRVWGDLPKEKRILWHTTFTAAVQPFYVGYVIWPEILRGMHYFHSKGLPNIVASFTTAARGESWLDYPPTPTIYYATGLSCGFMLMDTLAMVIWAGPLLTALRRSLYVQMWVHHVFSIVIWPYALCSHKGVLCVVYYVFTEMTNPLLNGRWLLENRPGWSDTYIWYVVAIFMLFVFFLVRIVPLPWYLVQLALPSAYGNATWLQTGVCVLTCPIPFLLNAFWFSLMFKKALRQLRQMVYGGGKGDAGAKKRN